MSSKLLWLVVIVCLAALFFLVKRYKFPPNLRTENLVLKDSLGNQINNPISNQGLQIIIVWATWCPPCIRELPTLEEVCQYYNDDSQINMYMVSDEDMDKQTTFLKKKGRNLPIYELMKGNMRDLGVYSIPCIFIYNEGRIVFKKIGAWTSKKELINTIEKARK
jgi:thiol-disulfide isomerase/thioredoxin